MTPTISPGHLCVLVFRTAAGPVDLWRRNADLPAPSVPSSCETHRPDTFPALGLLHRHPSVPIVPPSLDSARLHQGSYACQSGLAVLLQRGYDRGEKHHC